MEAEKIQELIFKVLEDWATRSEKEDLQKIFEKDPKWKEAFEVLKSLKTTVEDAAFPGEKELEAIEKRNLLQLENKIEEGDRDFVVLRSQSRFKKWMMAASFLLVTGLAAFFVFQKKNMEKTEKVVSQRTLSVGKTTSLELKDGTKVWLNKDSKLTYSDSFDKENRVVSLDGEAFFHVNKDSLHPFIVHLKDDIDIEVWGTQFNVKSYSNSPYLETSLFEGKITLNLKKKDSILTVLPEEKVLINTEKLLAGTEIKKINRESIRFEKIEENPIDRQIPDTAWMSNRFSFSDRLFGELAFDLERRFDKKFVFEEEKLKEFHLTGSFEGESLKTVLRALQITTPFAYEITEEEVILKKKN